MHQTERQPRRPMHSSQITVLPESVEIMSNEEENCEIRAEEVDTIIVELKQYIL